MEQDFGSECNSERESGWTLYLGHSMYPCDSVQKSKNDEDDDDMSMVSDASSGPPHVQEQEYNNNGVNEAGFRRITQDSPGFVDDVTSSNFFDFSYVDSDKASVGECGNGIADYSKGESRFIQDQFGHLKFSVSGSQLQQNQLQKP